jgi:hypothetical protein
MTDFALEQKLQLAEKTIEQLRSELEDVQHVSQLHYDANLSLRQQLAAQALVIEKLREAAGWVADVFSDDTLSHERDPELWLPSVQEALASTPDYTKLLAERDAALVDKCKAICDQLERDGWHYETYDGWEEVPAEACHCAGELGKLAAKIRAGVTI